MDWLDYFLFLPKGDERRRVLRESSKAVIVGFAFVAIMAFLGGA